MHETQFVEPLRFPSASPIETELMQQFTGLVSTIDVISRNDHAAKRLAISEFVGDVLN